MTLTTEGEGLDAVRGPHASHSGCLAALLPAGVSVVETREAAPLETLLAEERAIVASAVPKRAFEFATGRLCARMALEEKGMQRFPLLRNADRAPLWPRDLVGSITHTEAFCAAAVGRREEFVGIGIDAELVGRVGTELWRNVFTIEEIAWLGQLPTEQRSRMSTVLFSAKESFYKAQYALTSDWLGFGSATIRVDGDRWMVKLVNPIGVLAKLQEPISGKFAIRNRHVFTAIAIRPLQLRAL